LRLEFDGAPFCGWQLQPQDKNGGRPSIQELIENAIATLVHEQGTRIPVQGCGRTDAGVHAREFHCHCDLSSEQFARVDDWERFRHGMNSILPPSIAVTDCRVAEPGFSAIDSIETKTYSYSVLLRRAKPTLHRGRCYWIPIAPDSPQLDWASLAKAMSLVVGTHDFVAFRAANSSAKTSVRTIYRCDLLREPLGPDHARGLLIHLEYEGNGFLKHMVRNLTGSLLEILQRKRSVENLRELLGHGSGTPGLRSEAGICAPPEGLFLKAIKYRDKGAGA
jgi:tRNA pseudouridine38-40 synthase